MTGNEVLVVGGGVMGCAAARSLAHRGVRVTVLEQFGPGHDRGSSHGSSRIFRLAYANLLYIDLGRRALRMWRDLEQTTGRALLHLTGGLDHGSPTPVAAIEAAMARAGEPTDRLTPEQAAERWPAMRFEHSVLYAPGAGWLRADQAVAALRAEAIDRGATFRHETAALAIRTAGGSVEVVTWDRAYRAPSVVVAAGAWTPDLLSAAVRMPPLRVTREQPVHFAAPEPEVWPSFIHHRERGAAGRAGLKAGYGVYGLGSPEGVKVGFHGAGPVVRPDDPGGPDPHAAAGVERYVERWLPGIEPRHSAASGCLYELTPDEDFLVDRSGPLTVAAGFSGQGFKFAPVIGELVADLALGTGVAPPAFRLR